MTGRRTAVACTERAPRVGDVVHQIDVWAQPVGDPTITARLEPLEDYFARMPTRRALRRLAGLAFVVVRAARPSRRIPPRPADGVHAGASVPGGSMRP